jgi:maleylpyruvate isomerase
MFDPARLLDQIDAATDHVLETAAGFTDADVRAPSLLPGWSRGHVLTHLARNADGGRRLLGWARTGIESFEYPSLDARAAEIDAGSARPAAELLADVRESAANFATAYRQMPPDAWNHTVRWTTGHHYPAARAADSRLTELLIHHVDLAAAYTPKDWPADFVEERLTAVTAAFDRRPDAPPMRLHGTDTATSYAIGQDPAAPLISGPAHALLAWLHGRSTGADLTLTGAPSLPDPPFLY